MNATTVGVERNSYNAFANSVRIVADIALLWQLWGLSVEDLNSNINLFIFYINYNLKTRVYA